MISDEVKAEQPLGGHGVRYIGSRTKRSPGVAVENARRFPRSLWTTLYSSTAPAASTGRLPTDTDR